ncbi:PREDICTED: interleukin-1 receptor type 1 [Chrysochloris asiatica]|uniref:Interleukin-1 receptor type 1 n=1 Tax=Chrysochloris asiatica TaxID=185453 RepID=A0A9B0WXG2_CHRAS|nr:PREDICTED: interleukin-1 receptor type 1 [Chrysochloris asiatica]
MFRTLVPVWKLEQRGGETSARYELLTQELKWRQRNSAAVWELGSARSALGSWIPRAQTETPSEALGVGTASPAASAAQLSSLRPLPAHASFGLESEPRPAVPRRDSALAAATRHRDQKPSWSSRRGPGEAGAPAAVKVWAWRQGRKCTRNVSPSPRAPRSSLPSSQGLRALGRLGWLSRAGFWLGPRIPPRLSVTLSDKCQENEEKIVTILSANEIFAYPCFIMWTENKDTTIWYKNDKKTLISMERDSRIHQFNDKLWFAPTKVEDSGYYYCVVRNSTYCLRNKVTVKFVENEPNLCYSMEAQFPQRLPIGESGLLVCPKLDLFKDENNAFYNIQWYKDCKPLLLDNIKYAAEGTKLIIKNVTEEDTGKYSCHTTYVYLGKQYHISRVIDFLPLVENVPRWPFIMTPNNDTMEVELGSQIQLICNISGQSFGYWKWNESFIDDDDPVLAEEYVDGPVKAKQTIIMLNISKVESRFYLHPFACTAITEIGKNQAYVQLIPPVRDCQKHIIGIFVIFTVVIICSIFIYRIFKVDIVLWYRDSCYDFLPKKASDGKIYDAYILYPKTLGEGATSNSDIFVFKILPEVLENQCGYNLFIFGRNDYVGEDIVEVMDANIKKSRRLIIILVKDALGFSWLGSTSEEQIAMYSALIQDGIKVILLELEKIQDCEKMSESIKFIKQKHRAIRWSGDFTEKPQSAKTKFWKNVRYHMPAQRKMPSSTYNSLSVVTSPDSMENCLREVHMPLGCSNPNSKPILGWQSQMKVGLIWLFNIIRKEVKGNRWQKGAVHRGQRSEIRAALPFWTAWDRGGNSTFAGRCGVRVRLQIDRLPQIRKVQYRQRRRVPGLLGFLRLRGWGLGYPLGDSRWRRQACDTCGLDHSPLSPPQSPRKFLALDTGGGGAESRGEQEKKDSLGMRPEK